MKLPLGFLKKNLLPKKSKTSKSAQPSNEAATKSSAKLSDKAENSKSRFADWLVSSNPLDLPAEGLSTTLVGYVRWIPEHSDVLISRIIPACPQIQFVDLNVFSGQENIERRKAITQAAEYEPITFRRLALSKLLALKRRGLKAVILTLDWTAPLREIVFACRSLGITTILVPHESVFSTEDTFYYQKRRKTNAPLTDFVLCWGELQSSIFTQRGYPADRIIKVGSPKLDYDATYSQTLTYGEFSALFGLDSAAKTIAFTMQPMDNYKNKKIARQQQAKAISDVFDYCSKRSLNLLVRTPPSREQILPDFLLNKLQASKNVALDVAGQYILSPEETLAQADLVVSVNSTMLFEARLMRKPSIAMKYIDVASIWENTDIPMAHSQLEFCFLADMLLGGGAAPLTESSLDWAKDKFSDSKFGFDGRAVSRIAEHLNGIVQGGAPTIDLDLRCHASTASETTLFPSSIVVPQSLLQQHGEEKLAKALCVEKVFAATDLYDGAAGDLFVTTAGLNDTNFDSMRINLGREITILDENQLRQRLDKT